ncbi:MAG: sulfite exporter TauE/SafE family protein, partial [Maricaulaceae bacterium]
MSPELIYLALSLAAVGALAGFAAGMFGIGGGAVMVPALFFTFTSLGYSPDVTMHMAVGTSAAVIVVNAVRSVRSHNKHGAVDWDLLWPRNPLASYALWIGLGSLLAALLIAPHVSGQDLTILFAIVSGIISLQFIFGRPEWKLRDTVPGGAARPVAGSLIGGLSSLMGIGGGSIMVPLMSICGVPIHRAV